MVKKNFKKYPKAIPVTMSFLIDILSDPVEKEVYRQTVNWSTKTWHCPKRGVLYEVLGDEKHMKAEWRVIKNRQMVITRKQGLILAIWRLFALKDGAKVDGRKKWNCTIYKVSRGVYGIFYLVCKKSCHSIMGVY
jgi:hypothetical protein